MILQELYFDKYKWSVMVFYIVDRMYLDIIMDKLHSLGCSKEDMLKAKKLMASDEYNVGFTLSNFDEKASVIVIGITDSAEEFNSTLDHEKGHLAMHICIEYGIDPFSEEFQYLAGEIGRQMFSVAKNFLCENCRNKATSKD